MSQDEQVHVLFWSSEDNRATFQKAAAAYRAAKRFDLWQQVYRNAEGTAYGKEIPKIDTAVRFMSEGTSRPRNCKQLSNLLFAVCELIADFERDGGETNLGKKPNPKFEAVKILRSRLTSALEARRPQQPPDPETEGNGVKRVVPTQDDLQVFFNILSTFMKIERSQLFDAYRTFFTEDDIDKLPDTPGKRIYRCYDLYRPHSEPGRIVKSFLVIGLVGYPFGHACYFTNYFRAVRDPDADVRVTRGMTIPTKRVLYLIGEIEGEIELKILGIDDPGAPRRKFTGFLMTFQDDLSPIATRFLMKKSRHTHSDNAGLGTYADEELSDELGDDLKKVAQTHRMIAHGGRLKVPP